MSAPHTLPPHAVEPDEHVVAAPSLHEAVSAFKRKLLEETLAAHGGNRSRAAAALGIERTSLLRLIRELGIEGMSPGRRGRPASGAGAPATGDDSALTAEPPPHRPPSLP